MNVRTVAILVFLVVHVAACSDDSDRAQTSGQKPTHVFSSQVEMLNEAKTVGETVNDITRQEESRLDAVRDSGRR